MYRFRHHVAKICLLNSKEERGRALAEVPEEIKELVKKQVYYQYKLRKARKQ